MYVYVFISVLLFFVKSWVIAFGSPEARVKNHLCVASLVQQVCYRNGGFCYPSDFSVPFVADERRMNLVLTFFLLWQLLILSGTLQFAIWSCHDTGNSQFVVTELSSSATVKIVLPGYVSDEILNIFHWCILISWAWLPGFEETLIEILFKRFMNQWFMNRLLSAISGTYRRGDALQWLSVTILAQQERLLLPVLLLLLR